MAFQSYAELVRIDAGMAAELPEAYSFDEGAGITSAFLSAWNALVFKAATGPGETILVHGGAGDLAPPNRSKLNERIFDTLSV